jgi:hypothetical protein
MSAPSPDEVVAGHLALTKRPARTNATDPEHRRQRAHLSRRPGRTRRFLSPPSPCLGVAATFYRDALCLLQESD